MKKAQIGMVGLAVMGENLAMNMESHGFTVAVYDVRPGVVEMMEIFAAAASFMPPTLVIA